MLLMPGLKFWKTCMSNKKKEKLPKLYVTAPAPASVPCPSTRLILSLLQTCQIQTLHHRGSVTVKVVGKVYIRANSGSSGRDLSRFL